MARISFENIVGDNDVGVVPDGFANLDWDNFFAIDDERLERASGGNTDAIRTGEAVAFSENPVASFKSFDRADDFDLDNGYFTALFENDVRVKVLGFDDGERVAKKVLTLETNQEFVRFGREFNNIDEVKFTADVAFGMDDLSIA